MHSLFLLLKWSCLKKKLKQQWQFSPDEDFTLIINTLLTFNLRQIYFNQFTNMAVTRCLTESERPRRRYKRGLTKHVLRIVCSIVAAAI